MSKYLSKISISITHGDDQLAFVLKPMKMKDLLMIRELASDGEGKMLCAYVDILPSYIESVSGLKDAEGNELPMDVLKDAYFLTAVAELAAKHVQAATPENPTLPVEQ